jgi:ABC-type polysaccharide/polyol phosphate transport system ATPase subunit
MARIELDKVGLSFFVRQHTHITLKDYLLKHLFRKAQNPIVEVQALREVTLQVKTGERLGILGHNGAGKSTLLKLLAGIYTPTSGKRIVEGRVSSLFDINLGFEPEASGWENIAYRSYLQGETPKTVKSKRDAIAEFSELGEFLKMPVRYYSAGMMIRLAFSIATSIDPEILLIDEVLSVGDLAFQKKAKARMREMMSRAQLIVVVSHDLASLKDLCQQVVWMNQGKVHKIGPAAEVVEEYRVAMQGPTPPAASAA